jgi:aldose 1-epimerase
MKAVIKELIGKARTGEPIECYTLKHPDGMRLSILNWGACLTRLEVPDRRGKLTDIVLGLATCRDYLENNPYYMGVAVGRTAGRIYPTKVKIDGEFFNLTKNESRNHLHGGVQGLHNRRWRVSIPDASHPVLRLETELPDGLEGYPGTVRVSLLCEWIKANVLRMEFRAHTDRPTIFNPTRHDYFNLGGHDSGHIGPHVVHLPQNRYLPVDAKFVENLPPREVGGTPIDFWQPRPLGNPLPVMKRSLRGINYALLNEPVITDLPVAEIRHPGTGIGLRFFSNQQTLQFYTGNFLSATIPAKNGVRYGQHHGFCLEAMNFANGIHTSGWDGDCILRPGDDYLHAATYHFDAH